MKCSLGISNFLEEISSLSHSVVFLYFFALITEKGFLICLAVLWNSTFKWVYLSFSPLPLTSLFSAIYKALLNKHFAFLSFFFLGTDFLFLRTDYATELNYEINRHLLKKKLKLNNVSTVTKNFQ